MSGDDARQDRDDNDEGDSSSTAAATSATAGSADTADTEPTMTRPGRERPTLSADGAYALLWGAVALAAAALSFDGSVDPLVGLAGFAGAVGLYAAARDLLGGRPPASLEYLWMGTPALVGAGVAALDGRPLVAGGLGVVGLATLVEGYGWFGAGANDEDGDADEVAGTDGGGGDESQVDDGEEEA